MVSTPFDQQSKLQAKTEELVTADSKGLNGWGEDDPSVFVMEMTGRLEGDYQLTNGHGPDKAPQIMRVIAEVKR